MGYVGIKPTDAPLTSADLEDGLVTAAKLATDAVETAKVKAVNITAGKLAATQDLSTKTITLPASVAGLGTGINVTSQITGVVPTANLGSGSATSSTFLAGNNTWTAAETRPTVTSILPTAIPNTATAVVITGTNFVSVPYVDAINSSGAIVVADSVTYTSGTSITATFTLPVDGTYFLRVENPDGNAVRSSSALLNVSDVPAWVTSSGTLGTFSGTAAIATQTLTCTAATSFTCSPNPPVAGLTFTSGSGSCTVTGTQSAHTSAATDSFTVTATDAEGQTSPRTFSFTWSFSIAQSGGFY
tara:strand:- start:2221 stop:3123 length:903 start_codon:yes stop_codon:yes gene_type:complete